MEGNLILALMRGSIESRRIPHKCFMLDPVGDADGRKWTRRDTDEVLELKDAPVGAMWFATWYKYADRDLYGFDWTNQTTPPLIVVTPGGHWDIDSRASNCTMKDDRTHRCWIKHSEAPEITVDKNGATCQAGAGSIQCGDYHGFLQNGWLT